MWDRIFTFYTSSLKIIILNSKLYIVYCLKIITNNVNFLYLLFSDLTLAFSYADLANFPRKFTSCAMLDKKTKQSCISTKKLSADLRKLLYLFLLYVIYKLLFMYLTFINRWWETGAALLLIHLYFSYCKLTTFWEIWSILFFEIPLFEALFKGKMALMVSWQVIIMACTMSVFRRIPAHNKCPLLLLLLLLLLLFVIL